MEQFLIVNFDEDRGVIVNGAPGEWRTNLVLQLQAGTYTITLTPPDDFTPSARTIVLRNTTVLAPREIVFTRVPV